jgi:hypothetical protein
MENPTPRNLDPKFKDVKPVTETDVVEDNQTTDTHDETPMIVHKERYMDGAVQKEREHGPMPVSEWPAYEKEHNL